MLRWTTLCAGSVLCAALVMQDGSNNTTVMFAIFVASLVSSFAGFAFSAVCGAMLFHLSDDPVHVVQIMITCSIANQAAMTWAMRRDIVWRELAVYLAGGAFGLTIGVWVLLHANHTVYTEGLGVLLLFYGGYMLMRKPLVVRRQHRGFDLVSGFLGGITGGAAAIPSMPVTIWCSMKGWDKTRQRAMFQPFILIMQVVALLAIGLLRDRGIGKIGYEISDTLFVPAALLGTALGLLVYRSMSDLQFARAINALLLVSGLSYFV
jgi:uncharacterized membrane protein YfcA